MECVMGENGNKIIAGHYKGYEIQRKGEKLDSIVLIQKKILSKAELPMDKTTIKNFSHSSHLPNQHEIIIEWKDGKISQAIIEDELYSELYIKIKGKR